MSVFEIKNEEEAFSFLLRDLAAESVSFSGWPVLRLKIEGEDFDGSIPTRIMPAVLELQKEIYRTYALAKFGKPDIRKLSRTDRRRSEIVVKVEKGSANFIMDLINILNWMSKVKMTPELLIAFVVLSTVLGGGWFAKKIVNDREETKRREVEAKEKTKRIEAEAKKEVALAEIEVKLKIALSESETKRTGLITGMARENVVLKESLDRCKAPFENVMRSLDPDDTLSVNDQEIIDGEQARQLFRARRETTEEVRLDGLFLILRVLSGDRRTDIGHGSDAKTDWRLLSIFPALRSPRSKGASCKRASGKRGPYTCTSTLECVVIKFSPQSLSAQAWKTDSKTNRTSRHKFNKHPLDLPSNQMFCGLFTATPLIILTNPFPTNCSHPPSQATPRSHSPKTKWLNS